MFSFLSLTAQKTLALLLLSGLLVMTSIVQAKEVIIIPKGKGIVWQGKPFSSRVLQEENPYHGSASFGGDVLYSDFLSVTSTLYVFGGGAWRTCRPYGDITKAGDFVNVQGYDAIVLTPGLYFAVQGSFNGHYVDARSKKTVNFNGFFGNNKFVTSDAPGSSPKLEIINDKANCVSLRNRAELIAGYSKYQAQLTGYWLLIADGTQKTTTASFISGFNLGASTTNANATDQSIFPKTTEFKISTLECNINTPTTINFGDVFYSNEAGKELASKMTTIETYCSQGDEVIDSNINLTFRAISGNYGDDKSKLSLKEGGGYITGQLEGAQQSFDGSCGLTGRGIPFDNTTAIKLGHITKDQPSASFINPVLWRLCAAGDGKLPYGKVTASAEVMVTLN
ncbi:hypothetical protein [Proteus mirabilis]|uniref:hypothetical protein n=1 Tax=Proteus mirabilis TaxID=584 RepID=UPI0034D3F1BB